MTNAGSVTALNVLCACFVIAGTMNARVCASKEFKVGGGEGWREPSGANESSIYNDWAAKNRFKIGDSLRFEFTNDSVVEVDKWGFYHCNASNPIATFTDGKTTLVKLDKPGPSYFISGAPNHCKNGERLLVDVPIPHPVSRSPPSGSAASPQPDGEASPSPSQSSGALDSVQPVRGVWVALAGAVVGLAWCGP